MPKYYVEVTVEWNEQDIEAESLEQAEEIAKKRIKEMGVEGDLILVAYEEEEK